MHCRSGCPCSFGGRNNDRLANVLCHRDHSIPGAAARRSEGPFSIRIFPARLSSLRNTEQILNHCLNPHVAPKPPPPSSVAMRQAEPQTPIPVLRKKAEKLHLNSLVPSP